MVGAQVIRGDLVIEEDLPMDEEVATEAFPQGHTWSGDRFVQTICN